MDVEKSHSECKKVFDDLWEKRHGKFTEEELKGSNKLLDYDIFLLGWLAALAYFLRLQIEETRKEQDSLRLIPA